MWRSGLQAARRAPWTKDPSQQSAQQKDREIDKKYLRSSSTDVVAGPMECGKVGNDKDRNHARPKIKPSNSAYEKAKIFLQIIASSLKYIKQTSVFLHKSFRDGGGGGVMECGEVCNDME